MSGDVIFSTALSMSEGTGSGREIFRSAESESLSSDTSDTSREVVLLKKEALALAFQYNFRQFCNGLKKVLSVFYVTFELRPDSESFLMQLPFLLLFFQFCTIRFGHLQACMLFSTKIEKTQGGKSPRIH